jgi:hypothetical protein
MNQVARMLWRIGTLSNRIALRSKPYLLVHVSTQSPYKHPTPTLAGIDANNIKQLKMFFAAAEAMRGKSLPPYLTSEEHKAATDRFHKINNKRNDIGHHSHLEEKEFNDNIQLLCFAGEEPLPPYMCEILVEEFAELHKRQTEERASQGLK